MTYETYENYIPESWLEKEFGLPKWRVKKVLKYAKAKKIKIRRVKVITDYNYHKGDFDAAWKAYYRDTDRENLK